MDPLQFPGRPTTIWSVLQPVSNCYLFCCQNRLSIEKNPSWNVWVVLHIHHHRSEGHSSNSKILELLFISITMGVKEMGDNNSLKMKQWGWWLTCSSPWCWCRCWPWPDWKIRSWREKRLERSQIDKMNCGGVVVRRSKLRCCLSCSTSGSPWFWRRQQ